MIFWQYFRQILTSGELMGKIKLERLRFKNYNFERITVIQIVRSQKVDVGKLCRQLYLDLSNRESLHLHRNLLPVYWNLSNRVHFPKFKRFFRTQNSYFQLKSFVLITKFQHRLYMCYLFPVNFRCELESLIWVTISWGKSKREMTICQQPNPNILDGVISST